MEVVNNFNDVYAVPANFIKDLESNLSLNVTSSMSRETNIPVVIVQYRSDSLSKGVKGDQNISGVVTLNVVEKTVSRASKTAMDIKSRYNPGVTDVFGGFNMDVDDVQVLSVVPFERGKTRYYVLPVVLQVVISRNANNS